MTKQVLSKADQLYWGNLQNLPSIREHGHSGVPIRLPSLISLGAPDTADADGICASQNLTALGVASVDTDAAGAIAAAALAGVLDVPRNIVAAWTGTAVLTVTGTDLYDNTVVESSASGTSFAGKKALKTVTDFSVSGDVTGLTIGTGNVLGLPFRVNGLYNCLAFYADNTEELASATLVAAVTVAATATTGDVRGTITPNTIPNGSVEFRLWAAIDDPNSLPGLLGVSQYAG